MFRTRRIVFDGSEYFGPYPKPQQIDTYLRLIEKYFPLRRCRGPLKARSAPCLNYHMGRCSAPCAGKIDREGYARIVEEVRALLSGRSRDLVRDLKQKMRSASESLDFERAAVLRDQVAAIEEVSENQSVERIDGGDRDYVAHVAGPAAAPAAGAAADGGAPSAPGGAILVVLQVREGKLIGKEVFRIGEWGPEEESFSQFLTGHYAGVRTFPEEVLVDSPVDEESLSAYLRELAGRPVAVRMPQRGRHAEMIALARENAREEAARAARSVEKDAALERLARDLGLEHPPRRIEGFDIAHLEGQDTVASMVSFLDGRPDRKQYRIFNIRSLHGTVDDFESIREAVARRYTKVLNEGLERPDLVLIDGGRGQLSAAVGVLEGLGLDAIPVAGLAKKKEEVYMPGREEPLAIDGDSPGLRILQAVRDESHRFATTRHKLKRGKRVSLSLLEGVPGIGTARLLPFRRGRLEYEVDIPASAREPQLAVLLKPDSSGTDSSERVCGSSGLIACARSCVTSKAIRGCPVCVTNPTIPVSPTFNRCPAAIIRLPASPVAAARIAYSPRSSTSMSTCRWYFPTGFRLNCWSPTDSTTAFGTIESLTSCAIRAG